MSLNDEIREMLTEARAQSREALLEQAEATPQASRLVIDFVSRMDEWGPDAFVETIREQLLASFRQCAAEQTQRPTQALFYEFSLPGNPPGDNLAPVYGFGPGDFPVCDGSLSVDLDLLAYNETFDGLDGLDLTALWAAFDVDAFLGADEAANTYLFSEAMGFLTADAALRAHLALVEAVSAPEFEAVSTLRPTYFYLNEHDMSPLSLYVAT